MDTSHGNEVTAMHPPRTFDFDDRSLSGNKTVSLASISSSSSSPSLNEYLNPFIDKVDDASVPSASTSGNSAPSHFNPFRDDTDLPTSTFPTTPSSSNIPDSALKMDVPATQSPAVQIMERPGDDASPYRIPDYVFQRNKSRAPKEWSTASNESLFSIQMGHTSFTGDLFLYNKSGELVMCKSEELRMRRKSDEFATHDSNKSSEFGACRSSGDLGYSKSVDLGWYNLSGELATLGQTTSESGQIMNSCSGPPPQVNASNSASANNPFVSQGHNGRELPNLGPGVCATEGAAAETMKDVTRENEQNHNLIESPSLAFGLNSPSTAGYLDECSASTKSFTFPVLTKLDKSPSSSKPSSIHFNIQQQHPTQQQPHTPPAANTNSTISNTTQTRSSIFSCFSCCPLRP